MTVSSQQIFADLVRRTSDYFTQPNKRVVVIQGELDALAPSLDRTEFKEQQKAIDALASTLHALQIKQFQDDLVASLRPLAWTIHE